MGSNITPIRQEEEGGSFIAPATPRGNRAERRRQTKEDLKIQAKAKGQGPLSIEELLGETVSVDVLGDGRFMIRFYTHRFTSRLMEPVEEVEAELTRAGIMQRYVTQISERMAKEKRTELTEEEAKQMETFAKNPISVTGTDLTHTYITAFIGPRLPEAERTPERDSNRDLGLLASWTLTYKGEEAPLTWEFFTSVLGADLVARIMQKVRARWNPGETKGVASA